MHVRGGDIDVTVRGYLLSCISQLLAINYYIAAAGLLLVLVLVLVLLLVRVLVPRHQGVASGRHFIRWTRRSCALSAHSPASLAALILIKSNESSTLEI